MNATIFNIQRFSLHDGPGIRTTVFFKGCPLDCRWCANPESKNQEAELLFSGRLCRGCGACAAACPNGGILMQEGHPVFDGTACTKCFSCAAACPVGALSVEGEHWPLDELLTEVKKDLPFYKKSGGGVTLSGGEPLLQTAFCEAFLRRLQQEGIHTVVETTGYVAAKEFQRVLPYIDLLYFDCKHPDPVVHKEMTGVSNERILENLAFACRVGQPLVARIPVIPRFNYSARTAREFAALFRGLGVTQAHLLPFHQMGQGKWEGMNLNYAYKQDAALTEPDLFEMRQILTDAGLLVQTGG